MKKWMMVVLLVSLLTGCGRTQEEKEEQKQGIEETDENITEDIVPETVKTKEVLIWDEKELSIPKLDRDYEVWFMADSHITLVNSSEGAEIAEYANQRIPGFGNDMGVTSDTIFSQFIMES